MLCATIDIIDKRRDHILDRNISSYSLSYSIYLFVAKLELARELNLQIVL
jgi:hypothetical protein